MPSKERQPCDVANTSSYLDNKRAAAHKPNAKEGVQHPPKERQPDAVLAKMSHNHTNLFRTVGSNCEIVFVV